MRALYVILEHIKMTYLLKLLFVHMLIAIDIKHFESYVKSSARLWNHIMQALVKQLSLPF